MFKRATFRKICINITILTLVFLSTQKRSVAGIYFKSFIQKRYFAGLLPVAMRLKDLVKTIRGPGWRLVFSPAGSCAHHPVEKRNPYQRLPHLPLDFIQYKKIHVDRLGALILTLAIPRLQTVRQAPVFAAGY